MPGAEEERPRSPESIVHEAVGSMLDDGEIAVAWTLTIDVAGQGETRYLAHRAGGGMDGDDPPTPWTALGMLRTSTQWAEDQLRCWPEDAEPGEEV